MPAPRIHWPTEFFSNICTSNSPLQAAIDGVADILFNVLLGAAAVCSLGGGLCELAAALSVFIALLEALKAQLPSGPTSFGQALAAFVDWCVNNGVHGYQVLEFVSNYLLDQMLNKPPLTAVSYAILDAHDYLDKGCFNVGDSLEVFFDATNVTMVKYVDNIIQRVEDLRQGNVPNSPPAGFTGYVSLRFMQQTGALIGMQKWPATCSMEIAGMRVPETEALLATLEQDAKAAGATVHWGQRNDLIKADVEQAFSPIGPTGPLFLWRQALSALSQNGSATIFSTPFTLQRGLEVVQPLVESFSIVPKRTCAGSQVQANWVADENPPGTGASLIVSPPNTTIPLGSLTGSQQVALGHGLATVELLLSYAYPTDGTVKQDSRTIQVQGFQTGDVWALNMVANCQAGHWAVDLNLSPSDISASVLTTKLKVIFWNVPAGSQWTVSGPGFAGVVLSQLNPTYLLGTPTSLQGSWSFVLNNLGCNLPLPSVDIEFTVQC